MPLLATFVQISDLHIGTPDGTTGDASTTPDLKRLAATYQVWHGSLGHQARSLQYLQRYIKGLRAAGEPFEVIVTGDLTRCGQQDELDLAHDYLTSRINLRRTRPLVTGLQLGALPLGVPGNHDHWGGYNSPASTSTTLFHGSRLQPKTGFPYVKPGPTLLGRDLVFFGINSDADVHPGSLRRLLAHGEFTTQLAALGPPPSNPSHQLRIMVIHHARHASGTSLRMSSASRAALDAYLHAADIRVVLSGHTHQAHTAPVANVLELCSASTTQIDEAPAGWVNLYGGPPKVAFVRNGFLVHRLHDDAGALRWDVHVMMRGPQGTGFQQASLLRFKV